MILESVWTRDMFTCHTKSTEQRYKWEGRNGFRDGYSFISSTRYNSSKKGRKDLLVLLPFHYTRREITLFPSLMALSLFLFSELSCFLVSCLSIQLESHQGRTSSVQTNPYDSTCSCSEMIFRRTSAWRKRRKTRNRHELFFRLLFHVSCFTTFLALFSLDGTCYFIPFLSTHPTDSSFHIVSRHRFETSQIL